MFAAFCPGYWCRGALESSTHNTSHLDGYILLGSAKSGRDHIKHSACWVSWLSSDTASLHTVLVSHSGNQPSTAKWVRTLDFHFGKIRLESGVLFFFFSWLRMRSAGTEDTTGQSTHDHFAFWIVESRLHIQHIFCGRFRFRAILFFFFSFFWCPCLFCPLPFPLPQIHHIPWPKATRGSFTRVDVSWLTAR